MKFLKVSLPLPFKSALYAKKNVFKKLSLSDLMSNQTLMDEKHEKR